MPHPQGSKPVLPVWPSVPFFPPPEGHNGLFTSPPDVDGKCQLWGFDEFTLEAQDYIANQVGAGSHDGRSAKAFLDNLNANFGNTFQVQDAPLTTDQQRASVAAGCTSARMLGAGTTDLRAALHDPMDGTPWVPVHGGAFSNDNVVNGVVTWNGITSVEVLGLFRAALTRFIRAGGITT